MKRDEVLSLVRDLMVACETMQLAPVVSLTQRSMQGSWRLKVKWVDENEKGCFERIIQEKGLMATKTDDGYTVFIKAYTFPKLRIRNLYFCS